MFSHICALAALAHLVIGQYKQGEILTEKESLCQTSYYNWPCCEDTPNGYQCLCGAGFYWNTKICISDAVNSRLEFPLPITSSDLKGAFAYALLQKPFPLLKHFTLSLYMQPAITDSPSRQCIFSYKYSCQAAGKAADCIFSICLGKGIQLTIHNQTVEVGQMYHRNGDWTQLVVTWTSETGELNVYLNKTRLQSKGAIQLVSRNQDIESNGYMVLGQDSPDENNIYNLSAAYVGNLAHFNIWRDVFTPEELSVLQSDCSFTHCGNGVEWVDLREGTRGTARLRWPSGIDISHHCFSKAEALETCDKYCSFVIGVQCKQEIRESVRWGRTKAEPEDGSLAIVRNPCPGVDTSDNRTDIPMANRSCESSSDKVGIWGEPQMDACLSPFFRTFSRKVKSYETNAGKSFDERFVHSLLSLLSNHTRTWTYANPVEISVTISSMSTLLHLQKVELERLIDNHLRDEHQMYYSEKLPGRVMSYNDTISLLDLHLSVLNTLMDGRHDAGWNKTLPLGQESDELLQLIEEFVYALVLSLRYHQISGSSQNSVYRKSLQNIDLKVQIVELATFEGFIFPDISDQYAVGMVEDPAIAYYSLEEETFTSTDGYLYVAAVRLGTFTRLLYDPRFHREDSINTPVFRVGIYEPSGSKLIASNSTTVRLSFLYSNKNNISNPECVAIVHGNSSANIVWNRDTSPCIVISNSTEAVECECQGNSFFAATTDMYNEHWWKPPPDPVLMTAPSYLGCSLSLLLCISTLAMLAYVGTASRTAVMHKHYAVAVVFTTFVFMVGITQTDNEIACKAFAVLFHYFFLTMFAWLMNEGFNVYISITYTAHNQNTQENSGLWRYYIIGWGVPAVLVAAIVGASIDKYFSKDMCFVSWDSIWLFIGPPLALICVTLLVMIFAAKENNEVSYTKNESANAMTEYHANAVWTQLILITCTWSIAFLSLKFESIVFKWVFFILNTAQGAFLFVFFFLLNEEVRSVFKTKEIRQQLGWSPTSSMHGDGTESTIPLASTGGNLSPTIGRADMESEVQHMNPDELDTLTETSV